jgi:hypothetical protein
LADAGVGQQQQASQQNGTTDIIAVHRTLSSVKIFLTWICANILLFARPLARARGETQRRSCFTADPMQENCKVKRHAYKPESQAKECREVPSLALQAGVQISRLPRLCSSPATQGEMFARGGVILRAAGDVGSFPQGKNVFFSNRSRDIR